MRRRTGAKRPVTLAGIKFDALISQDEAFQAQVPDYPVESGYKVHDGVLPDALSISTTLYLTNTPVTWKSQIGVSRTRVKTVEARLRQLFWDREPITYSTSDMTYDNMVIESMTDCRVKLIQGDYQNIKVTTPEDILIAEALLDQA